MLSLSTCWNSSRHHDGQKLVDEILELGFNTIEVSHGMSVALLPGIKAAYHEGKMKVSGVHNFCPSPMEVLMDAPDCFQFTSHREYDRKRALELTLKTLETAAEFNAKYVVLHMGSVPIKDFSKKLGTLAKAGEIHSPEFVKTRLKSIQAREKVSNRYVRRAREALDAIIPRAEDCNVRLAVESRSAYEDVPSEREMLELMADYEDCPWVGYWHDFGHVERKANLMYCDHYEWLESMKDHLIGCHVHDVYWPTKDHRVPLTGTIDFDRLMPLVGKGKPLVWELSPRRRKETILEQLPKWIKRFGK